MPKRPYLLAVACFLAIPVAMIAGVGLFTLINPEMAHGTAHYVRDFRLLELARRGVLMATAGLTLILWLSTCYLVLKSRKRSLRWLLLAAAGPFGFIVISMLEDRSPASGDRYQQFVRALKMYWRVPLEVAVLVSIWFVADESVALKRELMIRYESFRTGTPVATIIDVQNASGGMWAFGEGLEFMYLLVLLYLLWPIFFNIVGRLFKSRTDPERQPS